MSATQFLCLIALAPAALSAQTIGGRVVDSASGKPLSQVSVTALEATLDSAVAKAQTDTSGIFYLELRGAGTFRIRFDAVPTSLTLRDSFTVAVGDFVEREFVLSLPANPEFLVSQVDRRARIKPGNNIIRYPEDKYANKVNGSVVVMYVVDRSGQIERESITILKSTDRAFTAAVMSGLQRLQFEPAEFRGRAVRQVVQQSFQFCLGACRTSRTKEPDPYGVIVTAGPVPPPRPAAHPETESG